jgi:microcystin-dependent protein
MANKKITELDDGGNLEQNDIAPIARNNRTYKVKIGEYMVPVGSIVAFAGSTIPNGWLKCNGEGIPAGNGTVQGKTANFNTLRSVVGATLPDLRGYFIRGLDDGRDIDASRTLGSSQDDGFKSHDHPATTDATKETYNGAKSAFDQGSRHNLTTSNASNVTVTAVGGTETRPKNVALHYIIKY